MKQRFSIAGWCALLLLVAASCSRPPGEWEFDRGLRELKRGRFVQARTLLEQSIAHRPGHAANPAAYNFLGVSCWKLGQFDAARAAFEDSLRLDPQQADAAYNLGVMLSEAGDHERAARMLATAASLRPQETRALEFLGQVQIRLGQWPEARRAVYAALARTPQSPALHTALAQVAWGAGDTNGALASLMKALELNARYAPALFSLGAAHQEMGHPGEAAAYFEKFITAAPADEARLATARAMLKSRLDAAPAPVDPLPAPAPAPAPPAKSNAPPVGATQAAGPEDILRQAQNLADKGKGALALELCVQVADQAGRAGRTELQERALRTATKTCFDQPRAHETLGRFLLAQKRAPEAIRAFKQAVILDSDYVPAQMGMARAAIETGEFDAALVGLKDAVRADAKNSEALWALADLYDRNLDLPENAARTYADFAARFPQDGRAAAARKRALELAPAIQFPPYQAPPSDSESITVTARAPAEVSAPTPTPTLRPALAPVPAAQIRYRKPVKRDTRDAVQALNRGRLYQEQKNWDQAIYYYQRSLENDDTMPTTFYYLASAYRVKGELDLAQDGYRRALQLDPSFTNARYNLALVYQQQNDLSSALKLLQEVVQEKPDYAAAHYVLGYIHAQTPASSAQARKHYEAFLQLAPTDPAAPAVRRWLQGR